MNLPCLNAPSVSRRCSFEIEDPLTGADGAGPGRWLARWAWPLLFLAVVVRTVSMSALPLTDPTEARYAQVAQEMALSGDWVTPRVWMQEKHIPFLGKPPLFFWAAAGAMKVFGVNEFAARLPSLLSALVLLGLLYVVLERYEARGAGRLGVLVATTCGFFFLVAGSVAVDMTLSATVAGSLLAYYAFLAEPDRRVRGRWSLLVFLLLALGFLTKGPVALVLFGLPVFIWTARWRAWATLRDHRWFSGALLFLLVAAPWYALSEARNPGFLHYFFVHENFLRFVTHDYGDVYGVGHDYPRGTALWMLVAATAPWSLFALWCAIRKRRFPGPGRGADRMAGFLLFGFAAGTLFWCLARQLLITYLVPMVPLFAAWLVRIAREHAPVWPRMRQAAAALLVVLIALSVVADVALRDVKTTRGIISEARHLAGSRGVREPLVFYRSTPYSALFYARGWAVPHPREALDASLLRLDGPGQTLVVVRTREKSEQEHLLATGAERLVASGDWVLFRVPLPHRHSI
jgi:4-amino-4-deoxy-L-arabinose transferase-like glycosyltransferase